MDGIECSVGGDSKKQRRVMRSASRVNEGKETGYNNQQGMAVKLENSTAYMSQSTKRTEDLSRDRAEIGHVDTSNGASVNVDAIDSAREVGIR